MENIYLSDNTECRKKNVCCNAAPVCYKQFQICHLSQFSPTCSCCDGGAPPKPRPKKPKLKHGCYRTLCIDDIINVLNSTNICVIAMCNCNEPYILPLHFSICELSNCKCVLKIAFMQNGLKTYIITNNKKVCILFQQKIGCEMFSVIAHGVACIQNQSCDCNNVMVEINSLTGRATSCK